MDAPKDHLQPTETNRGFAVLPPIVGNYGGDVVVWESSAADEPKLWLKVTELDDAKHEATIHLTAEDAWKLADQLRCAVENHYHGDARPEWAKP
jgi:hypothetical protein